MASKEVWNQEYIDDIWCAADLTALAAELTTLQHGPVVSKGCCPFHHEQTPSFCVNRQKKRWQCYGCGISGDCFNLIVRSKNCTYAEAVAYLAQRFGVTNDMPRITVDG